MTKSEWSELVPFRLLRQQESGAKNMQILYMFRMIWFSVSRANLTVRILRYEIEMGLRAVVFSHKQMGDCFGFIGLIIDIQELVLSV